ncbi:MAG: chemotaxis protein CheW, partial [Comamonadaceae bacterium]
MANRQALRELQTRLADRLQIARTQGVAAAWLAVEAGAGKYLFPLSQSGEIFPWSGTQRVPYTQPWFAGVANLRGGLYGVVDLASYVSGQAAAQRSDAGRAESRLVALNAL